MIILFHYCIISQEKCSTHALIQFRQTDGFDKAKLNFKPHLQAKLLQITQRVHVEDYDR